MCGGGETEDGGADKCRFAVGWEGSRKREESMGGFPFQERERENSVGRNEIPSASLSGFPLVRV